MENLITKEITRFSKSRKNETVFGNYILEKFRRFILLSEHDDLMAYAGAITEDKIPVLFTGDSHLMHRASQRLGVCYPAIVVAEIIEAVEGNDTLGNLVLESETMAYEKGFECGVVALYIEELDMFCYLNTNNSEVRIATVMSGFPKYFVNEDIDFICTLLADGALAFGFESSTRLAKSANKKFHGRKMARRIRVYGNAYPD